jgi:alkanesulfonate monooxygenase SsuD/methylene tetrahydromethanopterin reductase-like flavin-dependent oxidoreductase (luciferase family)
VKLDDVALDWPPTTPPPLMLGGAGPKSLALAARLGDGNLLGTAMSEDEIRASCEIVRAARGGEPHPVVATLIAATGPGAQQRVDLEVPLWGKPAGQGFAVAGDSATIAASIHRLAAVGVTSVTIHPTEDEPDLPGFLQFLGQEVRPLLQRVEPGASPPRGGDESPATRPDAYSWEESSVGEASADGGGGVDRGSAEPGS